MRTAGAARAAAIRFAMWYARHDDTWGLWNVIFALIVWADVLVFFFGGMAAVEAGAIGLAVSILFACLLAPIGLWKAHELVLEVGRAAVRQNTIDVKAG